MSKNNPRVLLISHNPFSKKRNNGKTHEAIFSKIPKPNIAEIYFYGADLPDFDYCSNYFCITDFDIFKSFFFPSKRVGHIVKDSNISRSSTMGKGSSLIYNICRKMVSPSFRDCLWSLGRWKNKYLFEWVESFSPNIIALGTGGSRFSINMAIFLSRKYNLPLVSMHGDNYLFSIRQRGIGVLKFKRLFKLYSKLISESHLVTTISDMMAEEYRRYFNVKSYVLTNLIEVLPYHDYKYNHSLQISYFGSVGLNRWKMITRFSKLIPDNVKIVVYTSTDNLSQMIIREFRQSGVEYRGSFVGKELYCAMCESDFLLMVESDDIKNRRYTKLAFSTKIPEYLMCGVPVLAYGPMEVSSISFFKKNSVGFSLPSEIGEELIKKEISNICNNFELRKDIGKKGYEYAVEMFDKEKGAQRFYDKMAELIN